MHTLYFARICCCVFSLFMIAAAQEQHATHSWDYSDKFGPSHWADLSAEFTTCKTGHQQSPIDIRHPHKATLPAIHFHYQPTPLHIIDNGHTVMINYAPGSFISIAGHKYALQQVHFHRPSEETINGKTFEMTAHLVHADKKGHLAVVAVLLQRGPENALIDELWKAVPLEKEKEERRDNIQIDVSQILPSDRSYYTFAGSLTTPPCTEHVTWFVLKRPTTVSAKEIERFSQIYRNDARPTQPLYGRIVLESK